MTQSQIAILGLIVSFVGGGTVSAIINWVRSSIAETKERSSKYIEQQLEKLYGPLYYLTLQSSKLFEIEKKLDDAYKVEYIDQKYSDDPVTRQRLREDTELVIELKNQYIEQVVKNNRKIIDLLDNNFALIDVEIFINEFYEHFIRYQSEEIGKTPYMVYEHLGAISFLRPEFIKRIKEKFKNKKSQFEGIAKKR
ncbi:hypothetical protein ACFTRD_03870 [Paenibacillus sp. NPDC056933]|uniref:hypothetical protein n=1 Tax=Paenibacillus sp. NPDC056933 TaxID=3345968 RepID=UPI003624B14E